MGATLFAAPALAAYPVSGKWTYDDVTGKGPAPRCSPRVMEFAGERRFDTEGGVHDYRNITTYPRGGSAWRITDEFFNGQARGRMTYTLTQRDGDHIEIQMSGQAGVVRLRRCG